MADTFRTVQEEFMRTHPGMTAGTALPTPELMRDVAVADAHNAVVKRVEDLERRLSLLERQAVKHG